MNLPDIHGLLDKQRTAFTAEGHVSRESRLARLQSVIDLLVKYKGQLCEAMDADFGGRHPGFSLMSDIIGPVGCLKHAREKLGEWMQPQTRPAPPPYDQLGAQAWVMYQPKGSVGIIGTWNAPVFTLFGPLAGVLAAGQPRHPEAIRGRAEYRRGRSGSVRGLRRPAGDRDRQWRR